MLSVTEARARILAPLRATGPDIVPLAAEARGRVLAQPLRAVRTHPPDDVSAMDGYAVRAADAEPGARLVLVGAAAAGAPFFGQIGPGQAARLFTGGVLPAGADAVLIQEHAEADAASVRVREAVTVGRHIRRAGHDFRAGDALIAAGMRLSARDLGLAAASGAVSLAVHRRPRVAILCTGDELVDPGASVPAGGIVSSNGPMLAALVVAEGGIASLLPIVPDDADRIAEAARDAGADFLVTTGGASVGDRDLVEEGLRRAGLVLDFWRVAMRPGKPMLSGRLGAMPVLGLPGNPVSAFVCAVLFLAPALRRLSGLRATDPATLPARLGAPVAANDHRADHLRATLARDSEGTLCAHPFTTQDSGQISTLARADALVLRPPHAPAAPAGAWVEVIALEDCRW